DTRQFSGDRLLIAAALLKRGIDEGQRARAGRQKGALAEKQDEELERALRFSHPVGAARGKAAHADRRSKVNFEIALRPRAGARRIETPEPAIGQETPFDPPSE